MIYAVKTLKSDIIWVMLFNVVYNFGEIILKHLKTVKQCLMVILIQGIKYALYAFWVP